MENRNHPMTGKSKATDGALDASGLELACQSFKVVTGEHVNEHLREAIEDAINAYLAALPPPTGAETAPQWFIDRLPEVKSDEEFERDHSGNAGLRGAAAMASESLKSVASVKIPSAAPPQVEPAETSVLAVSEQQQSISQDSSCFAELVERLKRADRDHGVPVCTEAATALTSLSAKLAWAESGQSTDNANANHYLAEAPKRLKLEQLAKADAQAATIRESVYKADIRNPVCELADHLRRIVAVYASMIEPRAKERILEAADLLTSQSAELLSLRRKVEEQRKALEVAHASMDGSTCGHFHRIALAEVARALAGDRP